MLFRDKNWHFELIDPRIREYLRFTRQHEPTEEEVAEVAAVFRGPYNPQDMLEPSVIAEACVMIEQLDSKAKQNIPCALPHRVKEPRRWVAGLRALFDCPFALARRALAQFSLSRASAKPRR